MQGEIYKHLWNPVVTIINKTQLHDTEELCGMLWQLGQIHAGSVLSVTLPRIDVCNMNYEYRVFDRTPDITKKYEITIEELLDIAMGAVRLINYIREQNHEQ